MRGKSPIALPSPYQGLQDGYYLRTVHTTTVILSQVRHPSSPHLLRYAYLNIWVGGGSTKKMRGGRDKSSIALPSPYQGLQDGYYRRTVHTTADNLSQMRPPSPALFLRYGCQKFWVEGGSTKKRRGGRGR
jgi:hypothetical protein